MSKKILWTHSNEPPLTDGEGGKPDRLFEVWHLLHSVRTHGKNKGQAEDKFCLTYDGFMFNALGADIQEEFPGYDVDICWACSNTFKIISGSNEI